MVQKLLESQLIDYVALDYKAPAYKFEQITHSHKQSEFFKTLNMLISGDVAFEVRTTLHADLLNENDINAITKDLKERGYKNSYFIQEFQETQNNIGNLKKAHNSFDKTLLLQSENIIWR